MIHSIDHVLCTLVLGGAYVNGKGIQESNSQVYA